MVRKPIQYDFYGGFPPHNERDTSIEAAASVIESANILRERIWQYLRRRGELGATDEEIQRHFPHHPIRSTGARRRELVLAGRVMDSGARRMTRYLRRAIVWVWVDKPDND